MDFVVLPDRPEATAVAAQFTGATTRTEYHASGRPWLIGHWREGEMTLARAGGKLLALFGSATVSRETLVDRLRLARTHQDLADITRDVPGSYHLVSALDGHVRVQGTLSDIYRIYYADVGGVTVAADRPDRLVAATGAVLDERVLASCLLTPYSRPPWPISEQCLWRGVHKLPPAHYLDLDQHGTATAVRWWQPPDPVLPLAEGAELLRARIIEAVGARVDPTGSVGLSIDLSGGMDSTSLCYVAEKIGAPFTTLHTCSVDPANIDTSWAMSCQRDLVSADHIVIPPGTLPGAFAEAPPRPDEISLEGPMTLVHHRLMETLAETVARAGSGRHLRGDGADELFQPSMTYTTAMVRRHPLRSLPAAARLKAANRWSTATTLRKLRGTAGYRRWLAGVSGRLTAPHDYQPTPGWEIPCQMPQWATSVAAGMVRAVFDEALACGIRPLVEDPVQNGILRQVQLLGATGRQCTQIGERFGVSFESPYLDLRVVEAALSIRFEDRVAPGVNKRVLAAAMQGIVPADVLARRDKSHATRDMFDSLRRGRSRLVELCTDPELARRDLIDGNTLRSIVLGIHPDLTPVIQLGPTRATELWLRALSDRPADLTDLSKT